MRFMMVVYGSERPVLNATAASPVSIASGEKQLVSRPVVAKLSLDPPSDATCVRIREGQRSVTPGAAAKEAQQVVECYIIDVPSKEDAIAIAHRVPIGHGETIEIRAILELEGLPAEKRFPDVKNRMIMMLLSYDDEQAWSRAGSEALRAGMDEAVALCHQLDARGQYCAASPLQPSSTATCMRVRNGQRDVTDGPFVETREVLGGYYVLTVENINDAIEIAAQHPGARFGTAELRQVSEVFAPLE